jgi:hypothetical protein
MDLSRAREGFRVGKLARDTGDAARYDRRVRARIKRLKRDEQARRA